MVDGAIQSDHFLNNGIRFSIKLLLVLSWVIAALADNSFFLTRFHVSFERAIVVANHAFDWIVKSIANIVCRRRDETWSLDVIDDKSFAIWADTLENFGVEATISLGAVLPVFVLEGQIIVEEIVAGYEFATVPFRDVFTLKIAKHGLEIESRFNYYEVHV